MKKFSKTISSPKSLKQVISSLFVEIKHVAEKDSKNIYFSYRQVDDSDNITDVDVILHDTGDGETYSFAVKGESENCSPLEVMLVVNASVLHFHKNYANQYKIVGI